MHISELASHDSTEPPLCRCGHSMDFHHLDTDYPGLAPCQECDCRCYRRRPLQLVK